MTCQCGELYTAETDFPLNCEFRLHYGCLSPILPLYVDGTFAGHRIKEYPDGVPNLKIHILGFRLTHLKEKSWKQ